MSETGEPRGEGVIANLMGIFVYLGPCVIIGMAVVFAIVLGWQDGPPQALSLALAISIVYLAFMGGARWGVTTCRETAPGVLQLLASTVSWAAGAGIVLYMLMSSESFDGEMALIIVALAFVPLLVLDGLIVFRHNGQEYEHPELRFLGCLVTVIALVSALIVFWEKSW